MTLRSCGMGLRFNARGQGLIPARRWCCASAPWHIERLAPWSTGSDPGNSRSGALALGHRSGARESSDSHLQADAVSRTGRLGYRKLRPQATTRTARRVAPSKELPAAWTRSRRPGGGKPLEIWFADEERVGRRTDPRRGLSAARGHQHQGSRTARLPPAHLSGPGQGGGRCCRRTLRPDLQLAESPGVAQDSRQVWSIRPGCISRSGLWSRPHHLCAPGQAPELNPMENVWQFLPTTGLKQRRTSYKASSITAAPLGTGSLPAPGEDVYRPAERGTQVLISGTCMSYGRSGRL